MITTTLATIKKYSPCAEGWRKLCRNLGGIKKYGADTPLSFQQIYESNGTEDMIWCLCSLGPEHDSLVRHYAVDCAERVRHLLKDQRSRNALVVARRYADGDASVEELAAAWEAALVAGAAEAAEEAAAWAAAGAAGAAAGAAAWKAALVAGKAAGAAAGAAAWKAAVEWQGRRLIFLFEQGYWTPVDA